MRSGLGLCVLGLLWLNGSVSGQEPVKVFCDDASVEKAVHSAVEKLNERLTAGKKLALFQIQSASKVPDFTTLRIWRRCGVHTAVHQQEDRLPSRKQQTLDGLRLPALAEKPAPCSAIVHVTPAEVHTRQVECVFEGQVIPEKAPCLGCEVEIHENSEDLKSPLSVSITKYNSMSDSTHLFALHSVVYATRQVVAGFRFKMRFDMKKTTCAKAEHRELSELCAPDDQDVEFANCNSTVDVAPWRHELPQANIQCEAGMLPTFIKRRPPGWTPLRRVEEPPSPSPRTPGAKEESSEEDTTASKPWKPFNPPSAAAPTDAPTQPAADAPALSDKDLLA
ncbi:unnamed protein product [Tetraodon nigroviridis]|uniref:(spotted green pufferfish) hypothetical protein n=1 Tax=Tetraodon nigroviridis TaxID=99883 RepID=Q4STD5_TETNG|nr:unnamed protein product [Tetraodon nigroviridis]